MCVLRFKIVLVFLLAGCGLFFYFGGHLRPFVAPHFAFLSWPQITKLEPNQSFQRQPVFQVDAARPLIFPISRDDTFARVVCHADIDALQKEKVRENPFVIMVEALDANGRLLKSIPYTFKAALSQEQMDPQSQVFFYEDSPDVPTLRHVIEINLKSIKPKTLRLKLVSKDPLIKSVWATVLEPNTQADRTLLSSWYRLPESYQLSLSRGGVFPASSLNNTQRENLIHNRGRPIGPWGVEGRDYVQNILCVIQKKDDLSYPNAPYQGFYCDPNHEMVIPLPEEKNIVSLSLSPANPQDKQPTQLHAIWYGKGSNSQEDFYVILPEGISSYKHSFGQGSLHISTNKPAFIVQKDVQNQPVSKPDSISYYRLGASPVIFDITGHRAHENIVRLSSLCILNEQNKTQKEEIVSYKVFNDQEEILFQGTWTLPLHTHSAADLTQDKTIVISQGLDQSSVLSQKIDHFISMPIEATSVHIQAASDVCVCAYNTVVEGVRTFKVPGDTYSFGSLDKLIRSNWFSLIPSNSESLVAQNRALSFATQPQPKPDDPFINQGIYRWDNFLPQGASLSRYVMVKTPKEASTRLRSLDALFTPIAPNTPTPVTFQYQKGEEIFQPKLAFSKKDQGASPFSLKINGKQIFSGQLTGTSGEILLPPIKAGPHTLEVIGEHRVFISHMTPGPECYVQKQALLWTQGELILPMTKLGNQEVITVTLLTPQEYNDPLMLDVTLQGPTLEKGKLLSGYTVRNRRYEIAPPNPQDKALILDAQEDSLHVRAPFFIKINEDLNGQDFKMILKSQSTHPLYIIVSRVVAGWQNERRLIRQGTLDAVE